MSEEPKKRLTIFCGAGLSIGAGLPSMLTFSHAVRNCHALTMVQRDDFEKIQIACSSLTSLAGASSRNLEDIASLLSVLQLSVPTFSFVECKDYKTPSEALELLNICIRMVFAPENHNYISNASPLVQLGTERTDLTVVTTNYDMNIELAAAGLGAKVQPSEWVSAACIDKSGREYADISTIYHSKLANPSQRDRWSLRLFKLHGSVNWYRVNGAPSVENRWNVAERDSQGNPQKYCLGPMGKDALASRDRRLVPPSIIKADGLSDLTGEWQGASEAITQADALWFIGYSFPESDTFMRYFLAGGLYRNTRLRHIVILDPDALSIRERTRDLFGSAELNNLVEAIPLKWETFAGNFPTLLDGNWVPSTNDTQIKHLRAQLEGRAVLNGQVSSLAADDPSILGGRISRVNRVNRTWR